MFAYTIEDVIQRNNLKNICSFSVQNLFRILLPAAIMSKAHKTIILHHICLFSYRPRILV